MNHFYAVSYAHEVKPPVSSRNCPRVLRVFGSKRERDAFVEAHESMMKGGWMDAAPVSSAWVREAPWLSRHPVKFAVLVGCDAPAWLTRMGDAATEIAPGLYALPSHHRWPNGYRWPSNVPYPKEVG